MNNPTLVLYHSKYGTSKQYAQWIAEALDCSCYAFADVPAEALASCRTLIVGSGVYASTLPCIKKLQKLSLSLSGKKLVVFAAGASKVNETLTASLHKNNLSALPADTALFCLPGELDDAKLKFFDHLIIRMVKSAAAKEHGASPFAEERPSREALRTLLDAVQTL